MKYLAWIYLLFFSLNSFTQEKVKEIFLTSGYGLYEASFVGMRIIIDEKKSIYFNIGSHFLSLDHNQFSLSIAGTKKITKFASDNSGILIVPKVIYWKLEDEYYIFSSIAFEPGIEFDYKFRTKFSIYSCIGPTFNHQLKSIRKSYDAIGWPKKIGINWTAGIRIPIIIEKN